MSQTDVRAPGPDAPFDLTNRKWPGKTIDRAPIWCSVDLRESKRAATDPLEFERKLRMFEGLVRVGCKEIEVGFPAGSTTDLEFVRHIVTQGRIPNDVTIQVFTLAREELVIRTLESVRGARRVIIHLHNTRSRLPRDSASTIDWRAFVDGAVKAIALCRKLASEMPDSEILLEYSPESTAGGQLLFAKEISEAVMDAWETGPTRKVILNLPAAVEIATPNVYADHIEWFGAEIRNRESVILSVHPHNDRGTAVAAAELALMAGADRVEGAFFGKGERTGNVDIISLALNLLARGVDPKLDIEAQSAQKTAGTANPMPSEVLDPSTPWRTVLRVLGTFQLQSSVQGDAIALGTGSQLTLLMLLVAARGEAVTVTRLASELWRGRAAAASRSAFDTTLHRLRRQLGDETLVLLEAGALRLDPRSIWVDAWAFYALQQVVERGAGSACVEELEQLSSRTLALYRGTFAEGEPQPSLMRASARLTRSFVLTITRLIDGFKRCGALESAVRLVEAALDREEASEALHELAMTLWLARGLPGEAERAYERCRAVLRARRKTDPPPAIERLLRAARQSSG